MGVDRADDPETPLDSCSTAAAPTPAPAAAKPAAAAAKPAPAAGGEAHVPKAAAPTGPPDPPPPADAVLPAFITSLQTAVAGSVSQVSYYLGDWTVIVPASHIAAGGDSICATRPRRRSTTAPT